MISIEVTDVIAEKLAADAKAVNTDVPTVMADLAARTAALPAIEVWDPSLSAEDNAKIKIGLAELEDGKGIPHDTAMALLAEDRVA
jgi:predicted transcriptional regulator